MSPQPAYNDVKTSFGTREPAQMNPQSGQKDLKRSSRRREQRQIDLKSSFGRHEPSQIGLK